jgi:hypothetical protein
MQRINYTFLSLLTIVLFFFSSCQAIGDIFKAGVWSGLILVAVVIAVIIFIISRFRK